jgi:hypothetical protein
LLQPWTLSHAQLDSGADQATQRDGLGVVVAVDVRDQDAAHVPEVVPDGGQRRLEPLPRLEQGPPGVDEYEPVGLCHDVDVHGMQSVVGQRQRYPVDPLGDRVRAELRPGVRDASSVSAHIGIPPVHSST